MDSIYSYKLSNMALSLYRFLWNFVLFISVWFLCLLVHLLSYSVPPSSSSFAFFTSIVPYVSIFWLVSSYSTYIFGSGFYYPSLSLFISTTGTIYTCLVILMIPVVIFLLPAAATSLCVSLSLYSIMCGPGIISSLSVSTPGISASKSGCLLSYSSTKVDYSASYLFYQSKGYLFF